MYKLLPEEERMKVAGEYYRRRWVVGILVFIVVIIISMVGLFPSYVLSSARQREVAERIRGMGGPGLDEDGAELRSWLTDLNQKLRLLSPKLDKDKTSPILEEVITRKVAGVRITRFDWNKDGETTTLMVSGTASDRQALIAFEGSLNASGRFGTVSLPVSNLARDKDIGFQVKLSLKPQTP
jgi:hypothetical protein